MSRIIAFHANDIIEAQIVCGMLEANGVQAWVTGHYLQGAAGEIPQFDLAKVQVEEHDLPAANKILQDYSSADVPDVSQHGIWDAAPES